MTDDSPETLLREISRILDAAGIAYMVVGSFASTFHGEPRTTRDLDLVIDPNPAQLEHLLAGTTSTQTSHATPYGDAPCST